ncbi:MAG: SDR family oxidoreductase, partial [Gammaproteobacteria bacterium]|nr:SDR family oxidoreductase [Gammaproteobacteria bacterium]
MGDPLRLYGLKALVTSGSSGIGEAAARTLVKHGASVFAVDTPDSGAEQHFKAVKGIDGYSTNLTDATRMPALIEEAIERLGGLDILFNDFPLQPDAPLKNDDPQVKILLQSRADL